MFKRFMELPEQERLCVYAVTLILLIMAFVFGLRQQYIMEQKEYLKIQMENGYEQVVEKDGFLGQGRILWKKVEKD